MKFKQLLIGILIAASVLPAAPAQAGLGLLFVGSTIACYRGDKSGYSEVRKIVGERMALGGFLLTGFALVILSPDLVLLGKEDRANEATQFIEKNFPYLLDQPEVVSSLLEMIEIKMKQLTSEQRASGVMELKFTREEVNSLSRIAILTPSEELDLFKALL